MDGDFLLGLAAVITAACSGFATIYTVIKSNRRRDRELPRMVAEKLLLWADPDDEDGEHG